MTNGENRGIIPNTRNPDNNIINKDGRNNSILIIYIFQI